MGSTSAWPSRKWTTATSRGRAHIEARAICPGLFPWGILGSWLPGDIPTLAAQASLLRRLHQPRQPLVVPNVWDVASARVVEELGFPVVATSSGAVAASLGYEDEDSMPADEAFAAVRRISSAVAVPVTADMEAGYRLEPEDFVTRLLEAGAVGCNLEDTDHHGGRDLVDADTHAARLAAIKESARAAGWTS